MLEPPFFAHFTETGVVGEMTTLIKPGRWAADGEPACQGLTTGSRNRRCRPLPGRERRRRESEGRFEEKVP